MPGNAGTSLDAAPLTLGRLVVLVEDYDAALAFYRAAFGARVGRQTGGEPLAVFYTPDVRAALQRAQGAGAAVVRAIDTADDASFAHVADLYGNVFVLVQMPSAVASPT